MRKERARLASFDWGTTASYVLVNARIAYALRKTQWAMLGLSATNLFNRRIMQHVFGDIVPRQVTADLRVEWGRR